MKQPESQRRLVWRPVAPLAGAWIETGLPVWDRWGMCVAPLAGAWIETPYHSNSNDSKPVAPLAGAWIETYTQVGY